MKLVRNLEKNFERRKSRDKILTIEASGIAIATASQYFDYVPVVFAKKTESLNLDKDVYESNDIYLQTKDYKVRVGKQFLNKGEKSFNN